MALQTKTLAVLLSEIKQEARIKGSDNLDPFITALINELLLDYVERARYFELLLLAQPITLIGATGLYDLPDGFHKMRGARYKIGASLPYSLYPRGQYVPQTAGGFPRYYEVAGNTISLLPPENIREDDTFVIDYYKYPDELVSPSDEFPIPRLIGPLKLKAVTRAVIYNRELNVAGALNNEALRQEAGSAVPKGQE